MRILNLLGTFGLALLVFGCSQPYNSESEAPEVAEVMPASSSEQTMSVLDHHLKSFGENNLSEVMSDYTDQSILITPDTSFVGLQQIESFFTNLIPSFPTEGTQINLTKLVVENDLAFIVWNAQTPTLNVPLGTDTFIIQNGKIKQQTFAGVINPVE